MSGQKLLKWFQKNNTQVFVFVSFSKILFSYILLAFANKKIHLTCIIRLIMMTKKRLTILSYPHTPKNNSYYFSLVCNTPQCLSLCCMETSSEMRFPLRNRNRNQNLVETRGTSLPKRFWNIFFKNTLRAFLRHNVLNQ